MIFLGSRRESIRMMLSLRVVPLNDGVVDDDERIDAFADCAIGYVIDVLDHFVTAGIFRYECAHFDVLDGDLFHPDLAGQHFHQFFLRDVITPGKDALDLDAFEVIVHAFPEAIEGYFGSIGDEREDSIFQVVVDGVEDLPAEVIAEGYTFAIDLFVAAAGEIDAFETTGPAFFRFQDRFY